MAPDPVNLHSPATSSTDSTDPIITPAATPTITTDNFNTEHLDSIGITEIPDRDTNSDSALQTDPDATDRLLTLDGSTPLRETFASNSSSSAKSRSIGYFKDVCLPYLTVVLDSMLIVTILLDCASTVCFVTQEALQSGVPHTLGGWISASIKTLRGVSREKMKTCKITLKKGQKKFDYDCLVIDTITTVRAPFSAAQLPSSLKENEFHFSPPGKSIGVLLGIIEFFKLLISHHNLTDNIFLLKTHLGPTLVGENAGKLIKSELLDEIESNIISTEQMDSLVKRYWHFEKLPGDADTDLSADDYFALKHMEENTTYCPIDKRFTVKHIFREKPDLMNNSRQARAQFLSLERKFLKPGMEKDVAMYVDHFKDALDKEIFIEVSPEEKAEAENLANNDLHFLIHFPVLRPGHSSTPCRPVFSPAQPTPSKEQANCHSKTGYKRGKLKGPTLNAGIAKGPNYMNNIPELTLAFRQGKWVVMADIKRQFHSIRIHPDHQKYGYFYFRDPRDASAELKVYKIARTYFGLACAPAQAGFCMRKIAEIMKDRHPDDALLQEAAQIMLKTNYADDYLWSFNDEKHGIKIVAKMQEILSEGSFHLTKFVSNNPRVLESIPEEKRAPCNRYEIIAQEDNDLPLSDDSKVLGLFYSANEDSYLLDYQNYEDLMAFNKNTRRSMLKILATLAYDILGGRTAFVLKGRVLLQESYREREDGKKPYGWDEKFDEPLLSKWERFVSKIPDLQGFVLARRLPTHLPYRIILMSDASNTCIAAAAWLVWETAGKKNKTKFESRLIMCRGKVRALKDRNSIPKAELQALCLSRELLLTIQAAWKCNLNVFQMFVDSMVVYHWCRMTAERLGVFHMNRVSKIKELGIEVKYICSEENGADAICKTSDPDYCKSAEFLQGKSWIRQPQENYPDDGRILSTELHKMNDEDRKAYLDGFRSQQITVNTTEIVPEISVEEQNFISEFYETKHEIVRGSKRFVEKDETSPDLPTETQLISVISLLAVDSNIFFQMMYSFSHLDPLLTRIALIFRFLHRLRQMKGSLKERTKTWAKLKAGEVLTEAQKGPTLKLLKDRALIFLVKLSQHRYFADSIAALKAGKAVAKGTSLHKLSPFFDPRDRELLRLKTRLEYDLHAPTSSVYPMVLPHRGPLSRLIVKHAHHFYYHATEMSIRKTVRQEFWIIRLEHLVRWVIRSCTDCNRINSTAAQQGMSPLVKDRLELKSTYPLHTLSIDVFGPFVVRNQWQPRGADKKVWVLAAICMKTSFLIALPLYSLNLENLLTALKSLMNRYCGRVKRIVSDNYSTFKSAAGEFKELETFFKDNKDAIEMTAAKIGLDWAFIPVYSAWYNGLIEKSGGLLKKSLLAAFKGHKLGHIDFEQAVTACTCMANQRPLLPITNKQGTIIVSPANLIFGDFSANYCLDFDDTTKKSDLIGRWEQRREIYNSFERIWHSSYLDHIARRTKWNTFRDNLVVGDICLVKLPRPVKKNAYPLALILELTPSADGFKRLAKIQYANYIPLNKKVKRANWKAHYGFGKKAVIESCPIQRLFPLEGARPAVGQAIDEKELHETAYTQLWSSQIASKQAFFGHYTTEVYTTVAPIDGNNESI